MPKGKVGVPLIICDGCKETKALHAKGLCRSCYGKLWRTTNHHHVKKLIARWAKEHPEAMRAAAIRYAASHPDERRATQQRRIARLHEVPATLTADQWAAIVAAYKGRCAYCGKQAKRLTQDHVVPVVMGGGYTSDNIVPACYGCNCRKHTGPPPKPVQTMLL